jgi:hypothetical protein
MKKKIKQKSKSEWKDIPKDKWKSIQKKLKTGKMKIVVTDHVKSKLQKDKEMKTWANQKVNIICTMSEAGDLMDLLFMADAGPFNNAFRETIKLNNMEKPYSQWLDRMVGIVCPEISKRKIRNGSIKLLKSYSKEIKNYGRRK